MTDSPVSPPQATSEQAPRSRPAVLPEIRNWWVATSIAIVMIVLALIGVGISTTSGPRSAATFWIALIPLYGALCVGAAWVRGWYDRVFDLRIILRQIFHWLGIAIAVGLDYYIRDTGEETGASSGLTALLLLALGCYLAGIHLEPVFIFVGVLLSLTLVCVLKFEQFQWVIFVAGGLTIALMFVLRQVLGRSRVASPGSGA